jgi:hypothetical protein
MSAAMKSLVEVLREPESVAAIALLIQAAILFLQAVILPVRPRFRMPGFL